MPPARILFLVSAIGLAALVAACGGTASGTPGVASASQEPAAPTVVSATPASSAASDATSSAAPTATPSAGTGTTAAACTAPAAATTAQTEGPYYMAGAPQVTTLVQDGMAGTRLTLTGFVVSTDCAPIAGATVDIWQADSSGTYDNSGYTLRGYVVTDATGRFTIETIVPGEYPGRTEHIHVKVTPPGGSTLTSQLYFPGTAANTSDGIYSPDLLLAIETSGDALVGTFTFVLPG